MIRLLRIVVLTTLLAHALVCAAQTQEPSTSFDVLIKGGTVYDGTGTKARRADIAIRGDRIAAIGKLRNARANAVIDAQGLAVSPGFINMLSHSEQSLIADGRSIASFNRVRFRSNWKSAGGDLLTPLASHWEIVTFRHVPSC